MQLTLFSLTHNRGVFAPKRGKRKTQRPLSTREPIHFILKSARHDLRRNERAVLNDWVRFARKFGVKVYRITVNHDHLHAIIRIHSRIMYARFAQAVTGALAKSLRIRWSYRPVTRIAAWGKDFRRLCRYLELNFLEANGFIDYQPYRTRRLPEWLKLGP